MTNTKDLKEKTLAVTTSVGPVFRVALPTLMMFIISAAIQAQVCDSDTVAPRILLNGAITQEVLVGTVYIDPGVRAFDNCDGDISHRVARSGEVDMYAPGVYLLRYDVVDTSGNLATPVFRQPIVVNSAASPCEPFVDYPRSAAAPGSNIVFTVITPCLQGDLAYQLYFNGEEIAVSDDGIFSIDTVACEDSGWYAIAISNDMNRIFTWYEVIIAPCGDEEGKNAEDKVVPCTSLADCDDGNPCTVDLCIDGICEHIAINCDDGDPCTMDVCDPAVGCIHIADGTCEGEVDPCASMVCDDGDPCTTDFCDPVAGCIYIANGNCEGEPVEGEYETGPCKTWTDAEDFDEGYSFNLEPVQEGDEFCLQLSNETNAWPYIAIANSGRNTIVRAEINTGNVVGEYLTRPDGMAGNPSRTTVDAFGNAWVGNRNESANSLGSVTRIGLIIGGTRVDASGTPDPNGDYVQNPAYCNCEDRDFDGLIKTSQGYPWVNGVSDYTASALPWPNTAGADSNGGVTTAEDECITAYVRVAGTNVRFVAVDPFGDVWTGGYANRVFQKITGSTATAEPSSIFNSICGGYGGLVDGDNVIWSAMWDPGAGSGFMRYDVNFPSSPLTCITGIPNYGVGIDPDTCNIWTSSATYDNNLREVDPAGNLLNVYNHYGSATPTVLSRGVVVSNGNVWVAQGSANSVGRVTTSGVHLGNVPVGALPTGVAVDTNGKIWATNLNSNSASRIDPSSIPGTVDLTLDLGPGAYPYNYSDMTGSVLLQAITPQGSWTTIYDSGILGSDWSPISWVAYQDPGTNIIVQVRASDSPTPSGPWTVISNNIPFTGVLGRYIQVQVIMTRPAYCHGTAQVKLCELNVCKKSSCVEIIVIEEDCDPITGDITTEFQVTNTSGSHIDTILLTPQTPNVSFTPNIISAPIPVGATASFNVVVSGAIPGQLTGVTVSLLCRNKLDCCSQTLYLYLDCEGCLEFSNELIKCDPAVPGAFLYTFQVKNRTAEELHHLYLYSPSGTNMTSYVHLVPPVGPSATSAPITLSISTNLPPGARLCFDYSAHNRLLDICCEGVKCITVPDCTETIEGEGEMIEGEGEVGPCQTAEDCDDGDPCTEDRCTNGECSHIPIVGCGGEGEPPVEGEGEPPVEGEGEPPVEGEGELPVEGEGEPPIEGEHGPCRTDADCDDGDPCTVDRCNTATGGCTHETITNCEGEGEDIPCREDADCDDGDPCTADKCNPDTGECIHDVITNCEGETGPCKEDADCDDGDPCTTDRCDSATGGCIHEAITDCEGEGEPKEGESGCGSGCGGGSCIGNPRSGNIIKDMQHFMDGFLLVGLSILVLLAIAVSKNNS